MAIKEHDREDLLRDGKRMPLRGKAIIDGETIVVGFRSDGQMSLYSGADPVFQFNQSQQLRRAFVEGQRYAAENGTLVKLTRESIGGRVCFERKSITAESELQIRKALSAWIVRIQEFNDLPSSTWHVANGTDGSELSAEFLRNLRVCFDAIGISVEIATHSNS